MHTAICAFDDQDRARQAVASLQQAGFDRHDIHLEHKHATSEGRSGGDHWDGMEREVAVDRGVLSSFGHFFASLLGRDNPSGEVDTYAQHVERGSYVVVVDADDEARAQQARSILQGLQASDLDVLHRPEQRRLRDIVGMSEGRTAGMMERSREPYEGWSGETPIARERAMASNRLDAMTGPELRDPEVERAPGLRYADMDKLDKPSRR